MQPKSHKRRNLIILLVIIVIVILLLARKKDLGLNIGSGRLSEEEKAALIEQFSQQANPSPALTDAQKESILKKAQTDSGNSSSASLSEEEKAQVIKDIGRNN